MSPALFEGATHMYGAPSVTMDLHPQLYDTTSFFQHKCTRTRHTHSRDVGAVVALTWSHTLPIPVLPKYPLLSAVSTLSFVH